MATSQQVQQLYIALLGRAADKPGLDWWLENINGGERTLEQAAAAFTTSEEYISVYGSLQGDALVTAVYSNLFERVPTTEEVAYWVADGRPADQLLQAFLTYASPADQTVINNKVTVAQYYSDATGANYNLAAAKAIVDNVNGTAGSVANAIGALDQGTLPGAVPGLALITKQAEAAKALSDFQKEVAKSNPTIDGADGTPKNGSVSSAELTAAKTAAGADRGVVTEFGKTTTATSATIATLDANVSNANSTLATTKGVLTATTDGAAAVQAYESALNTYRGLTPTAEQAAANTVAVAAATAGFGAAVEASGSAVTAATLNATTLNATDIDTTETATDVYGQLTSITLSASERAALVAETQKVGTYGAQLVELADKQLAINKAADALTKADAAVEAKTGGTAYTAAVEAKITADAVLADAKADDVKIAAVQSLIDQYGVLNKAVTDAGTAVTNFASANLVDLAGNAADIDATDTANTGGIDFASDVFYFGGAVGGSNDFAIDNFGAVGNDALVLGNAFTHNSGALSTGDNNVQEFFLVSSTAGVQVVVEAAKYGSDGEVAGVGGVVAAGTDQISVITLTGVSIDNLQVNDGVISYVA